MNVGVLSSGHLPSEWAHSIAVAKNAQGFADAGHDVTLLTPRRYLETRRLRDTSISDFYGLSDDIETITVPDRTPFYFQDLPLAGPVLMGIRKATLDLARSPLDPERRMSEICRERGIDVAYCRTFRSVTYCLERDIPVIMESHSAEISRRAKQRAIDRATDPQFRLLVTISEELRDGFIEAGVPPSKVTVLQDGVSLDRFDTVEKATARDTLGIDTPNPLVMYTGSLYPDKGIEHILLVAEELNWVEFVLVGGPTDQRERWEQFAADRDIDNVRFPGFVPNRQIPQYLAAADALMMPYKTNQSIDIMDLDSTSPLKLFEYMAASRPIVSTDIPAIARTLSHEEDALLAEANNISELVEYVETALTDEELANRLGENARMKATEYTWQKRAVSMLEAAERLTEATV